MKSQSTSLEVVETGNESRAMWNNDGPAPPGRRSDPHPFDFPETPVYRFNPCRFPKFRTALATAVIAAGLACVLAQSLEPQPREVVPHRRVIQRHAGAQTFGGGGGR